MGEYFLNSILVTGMALLILLVVAIAGSVCTGTVQILEVNWSIFCLWADCSSM